MSWPWIVVLAVTGAYLAGGTAAVVLMYRDRGTEHWHWWHYPIGFALWLVIAFGAVFQGSRRG